MIYFQVFITAVVALFVSGAIIRGSHDSYQISNWLLWSFYIPVTLIFFASLIACIATPLVFIWSL